LHANSSESPEILIVAPSGRAMAAAARRPGYRPLVVDFFDDLDTRRLADATAQMSHPEQGFVSDELMTHLHDLARGRAPIGVVYGSGFEDRPQLIAEMAEHFHIYGNSAAVVTRVKEPARLAELCKALSIPHPEIALSPPADPEHWLIKHSGGGGGLHVGAAVGRQAADGDYYQRKVDGEPVSVLLLATGIRAHALGLSTQWTAPDDGKPFRFGGAARPAEIEASLGTAIIAAAERIAVEAQLVGLNSVDFLVNGAGFHLLEINPRPGATLDIFEDRDGQIFAAHCDACTGALPKNPLAFSPAAASAIYYAPFEVAVMPHLDWPAWSHDQQKPGTRLHKGDPVCTVAAEAETSAAARALLTERLASFHKLLTESASKEAAA
jgi:predicted ATP-grasp superfamily ATP-dependent carboligase